jgi:hypothetical protein
MDVSLADFYTTGPRTVQEAFPPACLRTHWDPTMVVKHILPDFQTPVPEFDPRPAARICTSYHVRSAGDAPLPPETPSTVPETPEQFLGGMKRPITSFSPSYVFPPGSRAMYGAPFSGYNTAAESDLLRIPEKLTKCAEKRYLPVGGVPADNSIANIVPDSPPVRAPEVLQGPFAGCREADDKVAWERSSRLFFNPTKYDRTNMVPPGLYKAQSQYAIKYPY